MNELKLQGTTGGFPLFQNDFTFIQNATKESLGLIVKTFGGDTVVLHGLSSNGLDIIDGAIFYQDEIYSVSSIAVVDVSGKTLHINTAFDSLDPTVYKDSSIKNVHEIRTMEWLTASGSPEDTGLDLSATNLLQIHRLFVPVILKETLLVNTIGEDINLTNKLSNIGANAETFIDNQNEKGWNNLSATVGVGTIYKTPQVRKIGDKVEFRGRFDISSNNWSFILSSSFQPQLGGNSAGVGSFLIAQSGSVKELHSIETSPFSGGTLEGSKLAISGSGPGFPKTVDISTFHYTL